MTSPALGLRPSTENGLTSLATRASESRQGQDTHSSRPARKCRVCQRIDLHYFGEKPGYDGEAFHSLFTCPTCSTLQVYPFPGYDIYNDDYYAGRGPDPYVNYAEEYRDFSSTGRLDEFNDLLRLAKAKSDQPIRRWLDFGCGSGGFLKFLRARSALDPALASVQLFGHDVGAFADKLRTDDGFHIESEKGLEAHAGRFDVISCIEVLEHVDDPHRVIALLARLLRPGGILLLTTGNLRSLAARAAGLNYRYILPDIHVTMYNPQALKLLYAKQGLEPLYCTYSGVVRYKVLKSLRFSRWLPFASFVLRLPGVLRLIDLAYGVSAMPCARKPY